jgi:hypothetical protein
MRKKIKAAIGLCAAIALGTVLITSEQASAQSNLLSSGQDKTVGNFTFKSITANPDYVQNPSNTFKTFDSTGTNLLMISPTNNQFIIRADGSNSFSVLSTNIVVTNTAGQTHTIIIKNGLIVNYF